MPFKVEGHRRSAPKVQYSSGRRGNGLTEVDNKNVPDCFFFISVTGSKVGVVLSLTVFDLSEES